MARGRPLNPIRQVARAAGEKFYEARTPCGKCGGTLHYVSSNHCRTCAINRGKARYAACDKVEQAKLDHERYQRRLEKSAKPQPVPHATTPKPPTNEDPF
jgi:hypothetical protein